MNAYLSRHWTAFGGIGLLLALLAGAGLLFRGAKAHREVAPQIVRVSPDPGEVGVPGGAPVTVRFNESMADSTINDTNLILQDEHKRAIPIRVDYQPATHAAILQPASRLPAGETYSVIVKGGPGGVADEDDEALAASHSWTFTTGVPPSITPQEGPGGPILILTSKENGFSTYYPEILRSEGLNEFGVRDITDASATLLAQYALVLVGDFPVTSAQAALLSEYVRAGGSLVALHPDRELAQALDLNLEEAQSPLQDAYLAIDTQSKFGGGLVQESIQFHGSANLYQGQHTLTLATLYSDATHATSWPAVFLDKIGRGNAIVFAYDLARSVVYTRQGNPLWSDMERDGIPPIRSDDLFYGNAPGDPKPDWVDTQKIAIPQADEQQRLLANLILLANDDDMPMPRFWYLPRGLNATVVMTGDDHGHGGTTGRFQSYLARSAPGCSVDDWECIRATAYIFPGTISSSHATTLANQGFEIALHLSNDCADWAANDNASHTLQWDALAARYDRQLRKFAVRYPGVPSPVTQRIHCISWGDYDTQPQVELSRGIRLDTNYYYWPPKWVQNRPGLFNGSGMPMRFAKKDGTPIDVYQAPTQMTDESAQTYPYTFDTLLANALGPREYYGVFTANFHSDVRASAPADAVLASAKAHQIPVVSAVQMLRWLDGRNASAFRDVKWSDGRLSFSTTIGAGANGLQELLPMSATTRSLVSLTLNGAAVPWKPRHFAGVEYAAFAAEPGEFVATYANDEKSDEKVEPSERKATATNK